MTFAYVRKHYGLDVKRGDVVEVSGVGRGRLVRCSNYLHLRFGSHVRLYHPHDDGLVLVSAAERQAKTEAKEALGG